MNIHESAEDYLEMVLMLSEKGSVHSYEVAEALKVTRPSVSVAMKKLRENGYVNMDDENHITLTESGLTIASGVYHRHLVISKCLERIGVPDEIARADACRIEHDISPESFAALERMVALHENR